MFFANTFSGAMRPAARRNCSGAVRVHGWAKRAQLRAVCSAAAALILAIGLLFATGASAQDQNSTFQFGNSIDAQNGTASELGKSIRAQGATNSTFQFGDSIQAQRETTSNLHLSTSSSFADPDFHHWSFNIGAGFSPLLGDIHSRLNNGWHVTGGAAFRFNHYFSLGGQVMYNGFRVSDRVLSEAAVPDGNSHLWAFTAQPMLQFAPHHGFDPYLVGGVGYYRRVVQFTRPTVVQIDIFDPFFFGVFPVLIPADQVLGTITDDGIGGNAGVGVSWRIGDSDAHVFLEARYHYADVGSIVTRMIPITIGLRF